MKNLKITVAAIAISGLAFTSCMNDKKSKDADADNMEMNTELNTETNTNITLSEKGEMMASNNKVVSKDGITVERSMNNDVKAMQISGWNSFNDLSIEMKKLEGADFAKMKTTLPNISSTIAALNTNRPDWMMTEEIREDVEDLQKEYNEFVEERNGKEKEVNENIEEVNEAYADLVEEINETFDMYVKINRNAIEEYNEEAKDGEMEDAKEEYNEEIKKLNKIADDKQ